VRSLLALPLFFLAASTALAQAWPARPIRLVVPSAPGGTPDIQARIVANELAKQLGQQVVVDNRAGASGIVGYEMIAKSAPDGYTIGYSAFTFITNPLTYSKLPYDSARDFQPLIRSVLGTNIMAVNPGMPVKTVRELIDLARSQPGKLSYGGPGGGASQQLSMELLKSMAGVQITQVYYKGMAQAIGDTIGGQIQVVTENAASMLPHVVSGGRLRPIGVTGLKRVPAVPDIPTISEAALAGYEMAPSSGYMLPTGVPKPVAMRINAELNKALKSPAFMDKVVPAGSTVTGGTPEEFAEHIRRETQKWGAVIKAAGIKAE
jgi:tripartite-type tricarboxylate transporter receptor subunit TctC